MGDLLAIKVLGLLSGWIIILGLNALGSAWGMGHSARHCLLITALPVVLYLGLTSVGPDLLLACPLLFFVSLIHSPRYRSSRTRGWGCGVLGSLMYFSKSFGLPLFLSSFTLFNIFHFFGTTKREERIVVFTNALVGLLLFSALAGIWMAVLSDKYGGATIKITGKYVFYSTGPNFQGHPMFYDGFLAPPDDHSRSIWDDPSSFRLTPWSPLGSRSEAIHFAKNLGLNFYKTLEILKSFSGLSLGIILIALVLCIAPNRSMLLSPFLHGLTLIALFCGGMMLFIPLPRFYSPVFLLLIVLAFLSLDRLLMARNAVRGATCVGTFVLMLGISITPLHDLFYEQRAQVGIRNLSEIGDQLRTRYGVHGKVASNAKWHRSNFLTYFSNCSFYGIPRDDETGPEVLESLENLGIDYYLVWTDPDFDFYDHRDYKNRDHRSVLTDRVEVTGGKFESLRVYRIRKP
jgi:hypothetical protein